jgi:hypothetical protein
MRSRSVNETLDIDWDLNFAGVPPIGSELRETLRERWVRFHSLPNSNRYPDNEGGYAELLGRHNMVLAELTNPLESVKLITAGYSDHAEPVRSYPKLPTIDPNAKFWRTVVDDVTDQGDGPDYWHFYLSEWTFRPGVFDPLIRSIADEEVANVLIAASDLRWVLHPYDGGMDVIAPSVEERVRLRDRHSNWCSHRADGL